MKHKISIGTEIIIVKRCSQKSEYKERTNKNRYKKFKNTRNKGNLRRKVTKKAFILAHKPGQNPNIYGLARHRGPGSVRAEVPVSSSILVMAFMVAFIICCQRALLFVLLLLFVIIGRMRKIIR